MDTEVIVTGIMGILTTLASGIATYFFTRRKYNSEVDSNELDNLHKSLEYNKEVVEDLKNKLDFYINLSETNRVEVHRLKEVVHRMLDAVCKDTDCRKRQLYTDKEVKEILGILETPN